VEILMICI